MHTFDQFQFRDVVLDLGSRIYLGTLFETLVLVNISDKHRVLYQLLPPERHSGYIYTWTKKT